MAESGLPTSKSLRVYDSILDTIGNTPLVRLSNIGRHLTCQLYAKIEFFNPGGSVKDRIALNIIEEAEKSGKLKPGGTVVESTSGNTGLGLAIICTLRGYKSVFVMPDKMSHEKIQLLRAYGAKVIITPTSVAPEDPRSYYSVANKIVEDTPNAILANQYHNPENPRSHYESTGPEIWEQTRGKVTDVVVGLGTGGTISGAGKYLKEQNSEIKMVGVDATGSILMEIWKNNGEIPEGAKAITYKVEGIGEDFLPSTTDLSMIDEIVRVTDKESFLMTRQLVKEEGIFAGGSSGSALSAALKYAKDFPAERIVVVLLPDTGARYLSKVFDDKWMRENGYLDTEWGEMSLSAVLDEKQSQNLITASVTDSMSEVISLMKVNDISQVLTLNTDGSPAGLVREIDLLKHLLDNQHKHNGSEPIVNILQPMPPTFPAHTRLEEVMTAIVESNVIIVMEGKEMLGILSKIDILDFISQ